MTGIGNIYENSLSLFFSTRKLPDEPKFNRANLLPVGRVNDGDSTAAKSDINLLRRFIVTDVVSVIFKI